MAGPKLHLQKETQQAIYTKTEAKHIWNAVIIHQGPNFCFYYNLCMRDKLRLKVDLDFSLLSSWNGLKLTKLVWFSRKARSSWILNSWTEAQLDRSLLLAGPFGFIHTILSGTTQEGQGRWISKATILPHFLKRTIQKSISLCLTEAAFFVRLSCLLNET